MESKWSNRAKVFVNVLGAVVVYHCVFNIDWGENTIFSGVCAHCLEGILNLILRRQNNGRIKR
jgi:hypothetical protein